MVVPALAGVILRARMGSQSEGRGPRVSGGDSDKEKIRESGRKCSPR